MNITQKILVFISLIAITVVISSFKNSPNDYDYKAQWQKVNDLSKKGQPKSAIVVIDEIYSSAKSTNNTPQIVKSLIYRISMQSTFEEDYLIKSINFFETEIATAASPEKQILQSLIAELYQSYYSANRWKINQRKTLFNSNDTDISTWDAVKLNKVIEKHYSNSLANKTLLKKTKLKNYTDILTNTTKQSLVLWPTLFDLLSNRALAYFTSTDAQLTQIAAPSLANNMQYLLPVDEFVNIKVSSSDSMQIKVLNIFQQLLAFHINDGNTEALVNLDLKRLKYVYDNSMQNASNQNNYIVALTKLANKYKDSPLYALVAYKLANQYYTTSSNYNADFNQDNKYNLKIADSICQIVINTYPGVTGTNNCKNLSEQINRINFGFDVATAELPKTPILSLIKFRNVNKLYFKIIKTNPKENTNRNNRKTHIFDVLKHGNNIQSWQQQLPKTTDHRMHSAEVKFPKLEPGYYVIFASNDSTFSKYDDIKYKPIWITNLSYIFSNNKANGYTDMFTLNRETGKAIGNVNITVYKRHYNNNSREYEIKEATKLTTDKNGYVKIESIDGSNYNTYLFMFEKDGDELFSENYLNFYKNKQKAKPQTKTFLFTDRAIYRPGQTVFFKAIVIEQLGNDVKLLTNYSADVELINASRKSIQTTKFTTDENGSFNGSFIIPMGVLSGKMTIKCNTGNKTITVENYKLPTFEVLLDSLAGQPKLSSNVVITGKAINYAGSVVDGATVTYKVTRRASFPFPLYKYRNWYPQNNNREFEIASGNTTTSVDGTFTFEFIAMPDNTIPQTLEPVYNYQISAQVTDITGEVQVTTTNVNVGAKLVIIDYNMPDVFSANNSDNHSITAKNINGTNINVNPTVSIYKLTPPSALLNKMQWLEPDLYIIPENEFKKDFPHAPFKNNNNKSTWDKQKILSKQISINGTYKINDLFNNLAIGEYLIVTEGVDDSGQPYNAERFFTLFSTESNKLPGNMISWFAVSKTEAQPGESIKLFLGSAAKKSSIMYEIVVGNKIISSNWITASKGQKIINIPVEETYRGGFSVKFTMVRYNRLYSESINISVPFTNKELDIKLVTFRSQLTPGAKEEWNITISGKDGKKLSANLLAGMYDAALNVFETNSWQMNLYKNNISTYKWQSNQFVTSQSSALTSPEHKYHKPIPINYPAINWFNYQFGHNYYITQGAMDGMRSSIAPVSVDDAITLKSETTNTNEQIEIDIVTKDEVEKPVIPIRTNFSQTAFFYPSLKTDSVGNVSFSFTTPDALTEWKLMMLAYTNNLKVGSFEQKIKSQKELMIIPNLPRFVRQGDTLIFTAKIINFTDKNIDAVANIEFFDAVTKKPISIIDSQNITRSSLVAAKQSAQVSWKISIPNDVTMMAYKITATSGAFSDGEERMFPVLTNRKLITSTLPMHVSALSTANFSFDALNQLSKSNSTIKNYRFTLEFTSNPTWYAIQALPYLSTPQNKSVTAIFNSYFANTLSSYIVNSNPKIKAVFESWKHHSTTAFISNLEKNPSLKNAILASSPWVLEAESETEQKRRIGILFDVNRLSNQKDNTMAKLQKSQLPSGAWPWFKGMKNDRFTTQTVVLGMAKLHDKGVLDLTTNNQRFYMIKRAVDWLDKMIVEDFLNLKKKNTKNMKDLHINASQIQYLYLRALLNDVIEIPKTSKLAFEYFIGQEQKYWIKQSNYLQGMIAITLNKYGHRNDSEAIIRSLNERSLYSKEMGIYWRQNSGYNWYQAPIETQAMMIETMAQLDNNPTIIEQLKIWLLKQKQTQHWNTSSATAEAVFALIMYGNNNLNNNGLVDVKIGDYTVDYENNTDKNVEAGTGYFSTTWEAAAINPQMANITVTNPNNNIAWGAAYWQYFEDLDKIKATAKSPLLVTKKLFIEKQTDKGTILVALKPNETIKTGDKIVVQLTISSNKNIDYVQLTNMRATTFEPRLTSSGYEYSGSLGYYKNITDVSTEFFIQHLRKGTYIIEYELFATQKGDFTGGITTIQSMYAPEFASHSSGYRVVVE